jgi:hypothetical protein
MKSQPILANPRARSTIGFIMSVLFHALLLLFVLEHQTEPVKEAGTSPNALTVNLLPPSTTAQQTESTTASSAITLQSPKPKKSGNPKETANRNQNVASKKAPARPSHPLVTRAPSPVPAPAPSPPSKAVPGDMMDMLNAARERRRAAGIPDRNDSTTDQPPAQDENAIARANVEHSLQAQSRGNNDGGGLFEVTSKGVRTAEMIFHGWNVNRRKYTRQFVEIDAGLNGDIDRAIVRKMIEIIRQEKSGDFEWDSSRLNRVVTLSARPQDDAELERFLLQDFFNDEERSR